MRKLTVVILVLSAITWWTCDSTTDPATSSTGTLSVVMVDNAAAYDEVNVRIDSVQAHITSNDSINGWFTLNRVPQTYDLLKLVNGANAVIGSAELPVGVYSQIRLYVGAGSTIVVSGVTHPLATPSGAQSGIKLNVHAAIEPDFTYILVLDFDATKSIGVSGGSSSPTYHLKPVIKTLATANSGALAGDVDPGNPRSTIYATLGTDTMTTVTDTLGLFKFPYLAPGTYGVSVVAGNASYRDSVLTSRVVAAGATTNTGVIALGIR